MDTSIVNPEHQGWYDRPEYGQGWRETKRITLYICEFFEAQVHFVDHGDGVIRPYGHMDWFHRCPDGLQHTQKVWRAIRSRIEGPLYIMGTDCTPAFSRFVRKYGDFVPLKPIPCSDGKERMLFIHLGYD